MHTICAYSVHRVLSFSGSPHFLWQTVTCEVLSYVEANFLLKVWWPPQTLEKLYQFFMGLCWVAHWASIQQEWWMKCSSVSDARVHSPTNDSALVGSGSKSPSLSLSGLTSSNSMFTHRQETFYGDIPDVQQLACIGAEVKFQAIFNMLFLFSCN